MMSSDDILRRQNDERLLKIQYAARENYNHAENLNYIVWLFCLISAFSVFLPDSCPTIVSYGIPFVADTAALLLALIVNKRVKTAAKLRRYFDSYVLNIRVDQFAEEELRETNEIAEKAYLKNSNKAKTQMSNTGNASSPGVYEWYVFSEQRTGVFAQFECQRQNTWWNSKMLHKRLVATVCTFILIVAAFIFFSLNTDNIIIVLLCSAGLIGRMIERIKSNAEYIHLSVLIDGAQQAVEVNPTNEGVEKLQTLIDKRRAINVLEINWLHNRNAKRLSELYEMRIK